MTTYPNCILCKIAAGTIPSIKLCEDADTLAFMDINPANDGQVIRLAIPPLTEQRRKELARQVHKIVEEHKVAVRNGRRDVHDKLRALEKDKAASADEIKRAQERLQKITDRVIAELETVGGHKEQEIMVV